MAPVLVKTSQGLLKGREAIDCNGRTYYSFQGIPYAKPPVGNLRFKATQSPVPWTGVLDATRERQKSASRHEFNLSRIGNEDCLFLNVYTPKLPNVSTENTKLTVMFWVHGGGYIMSSGDSDLFGPEYLVAEDVVLVTINYRLGYLGFLSVPEIGISGNYGLKDIIMALKWVQKHISVFGGDPNCVTIFGQSAGASACHTIMLSPKSKGLFHRAILQCGTAVHPWNAAPDKSQYFLAYLGLDTLKDSEEILKKLNELSLDKILDAQQKCFPAEVAFMGETTPLGPVIEPASEEAVISEPYEVTLMNGTYHSVPLLIGYNSHEGISLINLGVPWLWSLRPNFTQNELLVLRDFNLDLKSEKAKTIGTKIKEYYYGDETPGNNNIFKYIEYCTDIFTALKTYVVSKIWALNSTHPVYVYKFCLDTELNIIKKMHKNSYSGPVHGDDVGYLFTNNYVSKNLKPGSVEEIAKNRMVKLWTNFAKNADPNPIEKDPLINVVWKPLKKGDYTFLQIGKALLSRKLPSDIRKKFEFWTDLYIEVRGENCLEHRIKNW